MKWIAALLVLGLLGVALYFLAIRDRSLQSYDGVEMGMEVITALSRLQGNGYLLVDGPPKSKNGECTGTDRYSLVQEADPTYLITISPDKNCKIRKIERKLRGMEL